MKRLTLTLHEAMQLEAALQSAEVGRVPVRQYESLLDAIDQIREEAGSFIDAWDALVEQLTQERLTALRITDDSRRQIALQDFVRHDRTAAEELREGQGAEVISIVFEQHPWDSLSIRWRAFMESGVDPANETLGRAVVAINRAVERAETVRLVDGKLEPVEDEARSENVSQIRRKRRASGRR